MVAAAQTGLAPTSVINAFTNKNPPEGPRYVPLVFDFTEYLAWVVDLMLLATQGHISSIQALWVDNAANTAPVTIDNGSGQVIQIPAGYQGYIQVILNNNPKFTVSSTGTNCRMLALNFPVFPQIWNAAA